MKLYGGLTTAAIQNAATTMGDAFEPKIPDKFRTNGSDGIK